MLGVGIEAGTAWLWLPGFLIAEVAGASALGMVLKGSRAQGQRTVRRTEPASRREGLVIGSGRKPPGAQITRQASTPPGAPARAGGIHTVNGRVDGTSPRHVTLTDRWVYDAEALDWLRSWDVPS
jgi:hypothetical protein